MRDLCEERILELLRDRYRTDGEYAHLAVWRDDLRTLGPTAQVDAALGVLMDRGEVLAVRNGSYLELPAVERGRLFATERLAAVWYGDASLLARTGERVRAVLLAAPATVAAVDAEYGLAQMALTRAPSRQPDETDRVAADAVGAALVCRVDDEQALIVMAALPSTVAVDELASVVVGICEPRRGGHRSGAPSGEGGSCRVQGAGLR